MTERDSILDEQIAYYRARAPEYDQWFLRQGRYDRGPEWNDQWRAEARELGRRLDAFRPTGRVLELACGTGLWTQQLLRHAHHVTAVDASPEAIAINRARVGTDRVHFIQADLFRWQPESRYDVVFFSFWLSHVPPERFEQFWRLVRSALSPGARVFFIDSLRTETSTAVDHRLPHTTEVTALRRLNDEREYRVYKIFYQPDRLSERLRTLGWEIAVGGTSTYFLHGAGTYGAGTRRPHERDASNR